MMQKAEIIETNLKFVRELSERDETDLIVIHHTGDTDLDASAAQIHSWHINNGWAGIGYHFVIRKNGKIERGRPIDTIGAHAQGSNYNSIGIHLCGAFNSAKPTQKQIESCALLIANLCDEYDLPIDRDHIVGHREVDDETSCPGDNLQALLRDGTIIGKAQYYFDEGREAETKEEAEKGRFNTLADVPEWAKPTIQKLTDKGLLGGNGKGLDLSLDMIRIFVIHDRAGIYDAAKG